MSLPLPVLDIESYTVKQIQYQLQQTLDAPRLKILEIYDTTQISKAQDFNSYVQDLEQKNIVHAFIPLTSLLQPISDICERGVRVNPRKGLKVVIGHANVDSSQKVLEFAHCLVALGNVQNFQLVNSDPNSDTFETATPTPDCILEGFNSLKINENSEFWIFNQRQIRTLQIIRTTSGKTLEHSPQFDPLCTLCKQNKAEYWCVNCNASLCHVCNDKSHTANAVLNTHTRIPMNRAGCYMEQCPFHPQNKVEHWCPVCHLPVCFECKLTGNHSQGACSKHQLIPLTEAYLDAIKRTNKESKYFSHRRRVIAEKLRDADVRLNDISSNERNLEDRIMEEAKKAIASLREQSGKRALIVRSNRDELYRKQAELDVYNRFLNTVQELSGPVQFIQAVDSYNDICQTDFKHDIDLPLDLYVEGDLALAGSLSVKPRQLIELPPGVHKRDIDVEEQNFRNTDVYTRTETTTVSEAPTERSYTYTTNGGFISKGQSKHQKLKQVTLSQMSSRKRQKLEEKGIRINFKPFEGSQILTTEENRTNLYFTFPFKGTPQTQLLFSSERDGRSIPVMHQRIDDVGITCLLIRRGAQVFGGFAAAKWNHNGEPFGDNSSSFLFQVSKDAFIPFKPRVEDACALIASYETLSFGKYDLVLDNQFNNCSSRLEMSYSYGLDPKSNDPVTFLAGSQTFKADLVEVWGFFNTEK